MAGETILIGDIHGCAREFGKLLEKIAPFEAGRIVLLGDLVNKGPDPGGVFRMAEAGKFLCLRGNHDNDHLRWQRGQAKPKSESVHTRNVMSARDYEGYLAMVERMPLFYENETLIAVHGAVLAGLRLQDQPDDVLTGDITLDSSWKDGIDLGKPLVVGHKRYNKNPAEPFVVEGRFYGIDTACVFGGSLTALSLPSGQFWRVKAARDYSSD